MLLIDAFSSRRRLAARGKPVRAPSHQLRRAARMQLALIYAVELALVFGVGGAGRPLALVGAVVGLVVCHVLVYLTESRPANLKPRRMTAG